MVKEQNICEKSHLSPFKVHGVGPLVLLLLFTCNVVRVLGKLSGTCSFFSHISCVMFLQFIV